MSPRIIDNVLPDDQADLLEQYFITSNEFNEWKFISFVANNNDDHKLDHFYFQHIIYKQPEGKLKIESPVLDRVNHLLHIINYKALLRAKANLYTNVGKIVEHEPHVDYNFHHHSALYFVNTNNGYTTLAGGKKVESVKNRLLIFDGSTSHFSSTCTDQQVRVTLNFNFF